MVEDGAGAYTLKRKYLHEPARHSEATLDQRVRYVQEYRTQKTTGKLFVFIDESPWAVNSYRLRGRAKRGRRCIVERRRPKPSRWITAITAISDAHGVIHSTFVVGTVDGIIFMNFLVTLFGRLRELRTGSVVLIMDNVGFHNTDEVTTLIADAGHYHLNTAQNSCELNPIEQVFHIWKSHVNIPPDMTSCDNIVSRLSEAFSQVPTSHVRACIAHVTEVLFPRVALREQLHLRQIIAERFPGDPLEDYPAVEGNDQVRDEDNSDTDVDGSD